MEITQTTVGLYVIHKEGANEEEIPQDVGVVIEGVELLRDLRNILCGCAMLFGLKAIPRNSNSHLSSFRAS